MAVASTPRRPPEPSPWVQKKTGTRLCSGCGLEGALACRSSLSESHSLSPPRCLCFISLSRSEPVRRLQPPRFLVDRVCSLRKKIRSWQGSGPKSHTFGVCIVCERSGNGYVEFSLKLDRMARGASIVSKGIKPAKSLDIWLPNQAYKRPLLAHGSCRSYIRGPAANPSEGLPLPLSLGHSCRQTRETGDAIVESSRVSQGSRFSTTAGYNASLTDAWNLKPFSCRLSPPPTSSTPSDPLSPPPRSTPFHPSSIRTIARRKERELLNTETPPVLSQSRQ